jgi:hypothetical protein
MTVGRELDQYIAQYVFLWTFQRRRQADGTLAEILLPPHESESTLYKSIPYYSTLIHDAWPIVEKLKISIIPPHACYAWGECQNSSDQWETECEIPNTTSSSDHYHDQVHVEAETACLAICLVAIEAIQKSRSSGASSYSSEALP